MASKKTWRRGKRCPDCLEGTMQKVNHPRQQHGVSYFDAYLECDICDYTERIKGSGNKFKEEFGR